MIAWIISIIYWLGFFLSYCLFRPDKDTWRGWIIDAILSVVWFITIPAHIIVCKKKKSKAVF